MSTEITFVSPKTDKAYKITDLFSDKERHAFISVRNRDRFGGNSLIKRRKDGTIWEPSHGGAADYGSLFNTDYPGWFFRRVEPMPSTFLNIFKIWRWKRTGQVWLTNSPREWEILLPDEIKREMTIRKA